MDEGRLAKQEEVKSVWTLSHGGRAPPPVSEERARLAAALRDCAIFPGLDHRRTVALLLRQKEHQTGWSST